MFRMKGVIPPVVTPFQKNGEVDYEGVQKLAAFLKKNVDGMFITGLLRKLRASDNGRAQKNRRNDAR